MERKRQKCNVNAIFLAILKTNKFQIILDMAHPRWHSLYTGFWEGEQTFFYSTC